MHTSAFSITLRDPPPGGPPLCHSVSRMRKPPFIGVTLVRKLKARKPTSKDGIFKRPPPGFAQSRKRRPAQNLPLENSKPIARLTNLDSEIVDPDETLISSAGSAPPARQHASKRRGSFQLVCIKAGQAKKCITPLLASAKAAIGRERKHAMSPLSLDASDVHDGPPLQQW